MDNTDHGGNVIPEEDFAKAISECRKDPRMDALFTHAPQGAKLFIGLLFYTQYFGENIDEEQYQAAFMDVETSLTPNDIDYLLRNDIDTETKDYLRGLLVQKEVADTSVARSVKLKPVRLQREMETLPAKNTRQSEFEQMVATEKRRRRVDMLLSLLKNTILLGIVAAVGYGVWLVFKGDVPLIPENSGEDASSHVVDTAKTAKESIPVSKPSGDRHIDSTHAKETPRQDFNTIKNSVIVIGNEGKGGGTAFILKMDGKKYLVTNDHVAQATDYFRRVYLLDGTPITLGVFEVAADRDMVRFEVDDSMPALELDESIPEMGGKVVIYGNSMGRGAVTEEKGNIKAIGPMRLEVDAKVVPGNSGSPVLDMDGKVIGILTYGTNDMDEKDWQTKNTRYADVRRWAVRFFGVKWSRVDWKVYEKQTRIMKDIRNFRLRLEPFIDVRQEDPKVRRSSYGLSYDELTKRIFYTDDGRFRDNLIVLSKANDEWDKAQREFRQILNNRNSPEAAVEERRKKFQETSSNFDSKIYQSLTTILDVSTNISWVSYLLRERSIGFVSDTEKEMEMWQAAMRDNEAVQKEIKDVFTKATMEGGKGTLFDRTKNCMAIVKSGNSVGSGFLVKMDGKVRFITNEHVTRGGNPFSATLLNGTVLKFDSLIEVAANRDLVRMTVIGVTNEVLNLLGETPREGQKIHIFGNSDGGGVLTSLHGTINGVGPDRIETQIPAVQGNSGSAILSDDGEVLGVFTFATFCKEPENWLKNGTRFNDVRRYGYRLNNVKWEKIKWNDYAILVSALAECERYVELCRKVCFRNQRLIRSYEVQEWIEAGQLKQRSLREAIFAIARADERWVANEKEWNRLVGLMAQVKVHALNDPRSSIIRNHKRLPSIAKGCSQARLDALKAGLAFIDSINWKVSRLKKIDESHGSVDAELFRWFFRTHIRRFREFFKEDLLGIKIPELPSELKRRL